jgi:hypothetical protein
MRALATLLCVGLAACAAFRPPDRSSEIPPALRDLRAAGFPFAPDVAFRNDHYAVCEGMACADLAVEANRRTILVADAAFASPSKLRASLLEIWSRYEMPRRGNARDLARAALLVVQEGRRAGVSDADVLEDARFFYGKLYDDLSDVQRRDLPDPRSLTPN